MSSAVIILFLVSHKNRLIVKNYMNIKCTSFCEPSTIWQSFRTHADFTGVCYNHCGFTGFTGNVLTVQKSRLTQYIDTIVCMVHLVIRLNISI